MACVKKKRSRMDDDDKNGRTGESPSKLIRCTPSLTKEKKKPAKPRLKELVPVEEYLIKTAYPTLSDSWRVGRFADGSWRRRLVVERANNFHKEFKKYRTPENKQWSSKPWSAMEVASWLMKDKRRDSYTMQPLLPRDSELDRAMVEAYIHEHVNVNERGQVSRDGYGFVRDPLTYYSIDTCNEAETADHFERERNDTQECGQLLYGNVY